MARVPLAAVLVALCATSASAVDLPLTTTVKPNALDILLTGLTADCVWGAGTVVAQFDAKGGNGKPITWSISPPGPDFVIADPTKGTVTVGPSGITPANCGTVENVTVTATQ